MTVVDKSTGKLEANFIEPASSGLLGGSYIDQAFSEHVVEVLQHLRQPSQPKDLEVIAEDLLMTQGYFKLKSSNLTGSTTTIFKPKLAEEGTTPWVNGMRLDEGYLEVSDPRDNRYVS